MDPVTLQLLLKVGPPLATAIISALRARGADPDATALEGALVRAEANFDLVLARARTVDEFYRATQAADALAEGRLPSPRSDEEATAIADLVAHLLTQGRP